MKRPQSRFKTMQILCATLIISLLLTSCGLFTVYAATDLSPDDVQVETQSTQAPLPPFPEDMKDELFPSDVQTVVNDGTRQILKTYVLEAGKYPVDIPRDSFEREGWRYSLTDITEKRTNDTDIRNHTETISINTDTSNLNTIINQLAPTMEYQSEDGYCGLLTLDLSSVKCNPAGYKNNSYTVTATREYPHLSNNDLSLIPKTITDNGQTLQLDDVSWEVQRYVNVDYEDIPESYRAVARYSTKASKSVVTGYVTTADYVGEVSKTEKGDTVYVAIFVGEEINPKLLDNIIKTPSGSKIPIIPILLVFAVLAALAAGAYVLMLKHRNVKIYRDNFRVLVAKDKIDAKHTMIDLTPLESDSFGIEIDGFSAKKLNGVTVDVRHGSQSLTHKIAYEGNNYRIEADFVNGTIQAVH